MKSLRFAVLGSPISHSKSPRIHAAAYRARGLPHTYEKLETSEAELPARVADLREGRFDGFNVTVPHKVRVLALVDEIDPRAAAAGAANTLLRTSEGRVRAYNTDVPAIEGELLRLAGGSVDHVGRVAIVLGSGGAARGAVIAAASLGFPEIHVRGRAFASHERTASYVDETKAALAKAGFSPILVAAPLVPSPDVEARASVVVQCTTAGMKGGASPEVAVDALAWDALPSDVVALDVVYGAEKTAFVTRAEERGLRCDDGRGMLALQGALAFASWLGGTPPVDVMRAALEEP